VIPSAKAQIVLVFSNAAEKKGLKGTCGKSTGCQRSIIRQTAKIYSSGFRLI
jgi:hypothetical protein